VTDIDIRLVVNYDWLSLGEKLCGFIVLTLIGHSERHLAYKMYHSEDIWGLP